MTGSSDTATDPILEVSNVHKHFGGLEVLKGINLTLKPGTLNGLIGPNGCGKSTLFDVVTGYQRPNAGSVALNGEGITGLAPHHVSRRGMIRTFQLTRVFQHLTVAENLLVFADGKGGREVGDAQDHALQLLDFVHLLGLADQEASTLSYGQLKLLEFAQVLMHDPDVLLLDEPFAGINPGLIEQLVGHLRTLKETGMTILLVEHNLPVVADLCDRIAVISGGVVAVDGPPDSVVNDRKVKEVFLGG